MLVRFVAHEVPNRLAAVSVVPEVSNIYLTSHRRRSMTYELVSALAVSDMTEHGTTLSVEATGIERFRV